MKIVALALANVALANQVTLSGNLHGGAGDHSFEVIPPVEADITSITTVITGGIMTFSGSPDEMYSRAEITHITGDFTNYDNSTAYLLELLGTTTVPQTSLTEIEIVPNAGLGSVSVLDALHKEFTLSPSHSITAMTCDNFSGANLGDVHVTLTGGQVISTGGPSIHSSPGYTYTIEEYNRGSGKKCGFSYTVTRKAYAVTACEDLAGSVCSKVAGYDLISPLDFAERTNVYTVNGYEQQDIELMVNGASVQHLANVVPVGVELNSHGGDATITANTGATCNSTLEVQHDCKYDELCFFSFTVGPCWINEWTATDAELTIAPYYLPSIPDWLNENHAEVYPQAVLPEDAGLASPSKISFLGIQDPDYTGMQLDLTDVSPNNFGIEIWGPAQYKSDAESSDDSYRIVGYLKFLEATLGSAEIANKDIHASSKVKISVA